MSDKLTVEKERRGEATDATIEAVIAAERQRCINRVLIYAALRDQAAIDLDKAASGSGPEKPSEGAAERARAQADVARDGEDEMGLVLRPDCAKLPYLLRAYFAFKMGLPFGYSKCTRGDRGKPPKCYAWFNIQHPEVTPPSPPAQITASAAPISTPTPNLLQQLFSQPVAAPAIPPAPVTAPAPKRLGLAAAFGEYVQAVSDAVQSGNGRTLAGDDNTDFYPVPLTQRTLRPGTIYADPYGHILTLVRRVPQSGGAAGEFLAADAEPDGTVARKLFWRGNFLFAQDPALGNPGFKRFRPIVRDNSGVLRRLTNSKIAKNPHYAGFSLEQSQLGVEDFYDRMDEVMSPEPLDPLRAMEDAIAALDEQVNLDSAAMPRSGL